MNIYNKISRRTLGIYDVKMLIVRMTMLVGDRNFLLLFSSKFRFSGDKTFGHFPISETTDPRRLIFSDMIENVTTMQNMKKKLILKKMEIGSFPCDGNTVLRLFKVRKFISLM